MSQHYMDVIPFTGFGSVRLGMTKDQILAILGLPNSKSAEGDGDESWRYDSLGLSCDFTKEDDGLLGSITFTSQAIRVFGVSIVGRSEEQLRALGKTGALSGLTLEEELSYLAAKNYECDALGLSFWVRDGVVQNMTLYPRYDASGNQPLWPE